MADVKVVDPSEAPAQRLKPRSPQMARKRAADRRDISVFQVGNRLEITANGDADGLQKPKELLDHYEKILKLLQ